jgi:hypothetical protein
MSSVEEIPTQQQQQPNVITLDKNNSINILIQYIEVAQKAGSYDLKESDILKRAIDVLVNNVTDNEINETLAVNLIIQGIMKGQKSGAYSLNDASLLHKVISFIVQLIESAQQAPTSAVPVPVASEPEQEDDDIDSLSAPVPLRPKEI